VKKQDERCATGDAVSDLYRQIFLSLGEALLWEDARGCVAEANTAAAWMLGVPRDTLLGQPVNSLLSPATLEKVNAHRNSERSSEALQTDGEFLKADTPFNIQLEVQQIAIPNPGHAPDLGWLYAARPSVARDELEHELRLQRQAAGLGYGGMRPATFYMSARDQIFRYPPLAPGSPPRPLDAVAALFRGERLQPELKKAWNGSEVRLQPAWYDIPATPEAPQPLQLRLRISIIPLRVKSNNVTDLCIRVLDETEVYLDQEERRWQEQQQYAELIHAGVQHDLNNLLGVVLAQASALRLSTPAGEIAPPQIQAIIDATHQVATLLKSSAGLTRRISRATVDLNAIVDDCGVDLGMFGSQRGTNIRILKESPVCHVTGDADLLRTMIVAFARYLQVYLPPGATLALKIYAVPAAMPSLPPSVGLSMGDDGTSGSGGGVRPPDDPSRSRELALARSILRLHRGQCEVIDSSAQGTLLELLLPGIEAKPALSSPEQIHTEAFDDGILAPVEVGATPEKATSTRQRILLADDEENFRLFTTWALRERGYDVVVAKDGQEALDRFQEAPESFSLAVLDSYMPRMGGLESYLRMQSQRPDLPVLFASGYVRGPSGDILIAGCPGPASVLQKPFSVEDLAAAVKKALAGNVSV